MKNPGFNFKNTYTSLPEIFFKEIRPCVVKKPEIILLNEDLAKEMEINFSLIKSDERAMLLSGNKTLPSMKTFAQAYSGHQFGYFTNLGDGRALMLGEHLTKSGLRLDIQFKGSGKTPFSRHGDGKAVLGPMLREYVVSEAMNALNIPTTRSLSVVKTSEVVFRESPQAGAVLTRVASSHIRVGTFQFAAASREKMFLKALLNYTVNRHYPELNTSNNKALEFLKNVMNNQINLITNWMRVGFVHGVMNTDNMTISGETIDYGPCAFVDNYHPKTVYSSVDHDGRYAFENQPIIAQWNLARFAETLLSLIDENPNKALKQAEEIIKLFPALYKESWLKMMKCKLGLFNENFNDEKLILELLDWMTSASADYTNTFKDIESENFENEIYKNLKFKNWHKKLKERKNLNKRSTSESLKIMKENNPYVIPRNHNLEFALKEADQGNYSHLKKLISVIKKPYKIDKVSKKYTLPPLNSEKILQTFCGT